jgi:hypothetical protein
MIRTREYYQKELERSQIKPKYQKTVKIFEHISFLIIISSILLISDYSNIRQDIEINKYLVILQFPTIIIAIFINKYGNFLKFIVTNIIAFCASTIAGMIILVLAAQINITEYYDNFLTNISNYKMITINELEYADRKFDNNNKFYYLPNEVESDKYIIVLTNDIYLIRANKSKYFSIKEDIEKIERNKRNRDAKLVGMKFQFNSNSIPNLVVIQGSNEIGNYYIGYNSKKVNTIQYESNYTIFEGYPKYLNFTPVINKNQTNILIIIIFSLLEVLIRYFPIILLSQLIYKWCAQLVLKTKME